MKIGNLEVYGVIYKITNIVNGKIYIGQTIRGFDLRYKNNLEKHTNNKHLKSSIVKYGINNFKINTIFDIAFSEYELNIKEIIWIDYYDCRNNGYNIAEGGDSRKRTRISNIINNIKNKNLIYCKEEHRVYLSINDFCKIHNVKEKTLQSNVRSKRDTTIGDKKYNIVRIEDMSKLIYCTGIEQIFYNKADIQRYFNKSIKDIKEKVENGKPYKGLYFEYLLSYFNYVDIKKQKKITNKGNKISDETKEKLRLSMLGKNKGGNSGSARKVICITTGMIFNCLRESAEYIGAKGHAGIVRCCQGINKSAGKLEDGTPLKWMYYDEYIKQNKLLIHNEKLGQTI